MKKSKSILIVISILSAVFLIVNFAKADTGPKPTMDFNFINDTEKAYKIVSGEQYQCNDSQGKDCAVLIKGGPQSFSCTADNCSSLAYGYKDYQKLIITFEDKKRESNIFKKEAFNSEYKVHIKDNELFVEGGGALKNNSVASSIYKNQNDFLIALFVTLLAEILGMALIIFIFKLPKILLIGVFFANIISLALFWIFFISLGLTSFVWLGLFEAGIVFFEALVYCFIAKKQVNFKKALLISLVLNVLSFGIGLIV